MARLVAERLATTLRDGDREFRLAVEGLEVAGGEVLALTGQSGAGKTLLLEMLGLLRRPDPGAAYRVGEAEDLAGLWGGGARSARLAAARGRVFGFVPQTGGLLPFLTVAENVALPQRITGRDDPAWARHLLDRLDLGPVAALRPAALSIGQRQRVAIARALAHRPPFVIADEPTAALDPGTAERAVALFLDLAREEGCGLVLSSHDIGLLDRFRLRRFALRAAETGPGRIESRLVALEAA